MRGMISSLRMGGWLLVSVTVVNGGGTPAAHTQTLPPGTYEVRVCSGSCDPSKDALSATGFFVVGDEPIVLARLPERLRRYLEDQERWSLAALEGRDPTVCFALQAGGEDDSGSMLTATPAGVTDLKLSNGRTSLLLFASPDAGYVASFEGAESEARGTGFAWAPGRDYQATSDVLLARRSGPPDLDRCLAALARAASQAK